MEKLTIAHTIVVEGRYDRAALEGIVNARIITTDGFGLFSQRDRLALLQRIASRGKIILLCDSDGGGTQIRSFITRSLPKGSVIQLYTPQVRGKEKRKSAPSKAGFLGVEGTNADILRRLLAPYSVEYFGDFAQISGVSADFFGDITKADFYEAGLSGGENSTLKRDALAASLELPRGLSANALLSAVNAVCTRDEFFAAVKSCSAKSDVSGNEIFTVNASGNDNKSEGSLDYGNE